MAAGWACGAAALAACAPPQPSAHLATPDLGLAIVPRAAWGALAPDHGARLEPGLYSALNPNGWRAYDVALCEALRAIVVHHSALLPSDGPPTIQRLHQRRGFADIGYHFLIDAGGEVFEGRTLMARGAHVRGHNTGAIGVCLLGNFERGAPTAAQMDSLVALGRALRHALGVTHLAGHRDYPGQGTACPGRMLHPLLPEIAAGLALAYGAR